MLHNQNYNFIEKSKLFLKKPAQQMSMDEEMTSDPVKVLGLLSREEESQPMQFTEFEEDLWREPSPELVPGTDLLNTTEDGAGAELFNGCLPVVSGDALPGGAAALTPPCWDDQWGQQSFHAPAAEVEGRTLPLLPPTPPVSPLLYNNNNNNNIKEDLQEEKLMPTTLEMELPDYEGGQLGWQAAQSTVDLSALVREFAGGAESSSSSVTDPDYSPETSTSGGGAGRGRKRGRPALNTPHTIPSLPDDPASLSSSELEQTKWRRMRDLNNESSRRCRARRKAKQQELAEVELPQLQEKNVELRRMMESLEKEFQDLRQQAANRGLLSPADHYRLYQN